MRKQIVLIAIVFTIVVYLSPFLYTQNYLSFIADFSSSKTSNIGSTIGGITAPIIGIVTSLLLYLALTKQTESNNLQKVKNETDTVLSLMNQMEVELSVIYHSFEKTTITGEKFQYNYKGVEALDKMLNDFLFKRDLSGEEDFEQYYLSSQLLLVISSFEIVEARLKQLNLPNDIQNLLVQKLQAFYDFRLKKPLSILTLILEKYPNLNSISTQMIEEFLERMGIDNYLKESLKRKIPTK